MKLICIPIQPLLTLMLITSPVAGLNAAEPHLYDSPQLSIGFKPRTPQQIAAFYEARGFSKPMINKLKQQCFITTWIHNKSSHVIWLDLSQWQFRNATGSIERRNRRYWKTVWNDMQIPLAHQSTFRWTLLPETLDFRPGEREGGNLILPRDDQPIQIEAIFPTQADKSGIPITIKFRPLQCAKDS
jgi:hypothetical protein